MDPRDAQDRRDRIDRKDHAGRLYHQQHQEQGRREQAAVDSCEEAVSIELLGEGQESSSQPIDDALLRLKLLRLKVVLLLAEELEHRHDQQRSSRTHTPVQHNASRVLITFGLRLSTKRSSASMTSTNTMKEIQTKVSVKRKVSAEAGGTKPLPGKVGEALAQTAGLFAIGEDMSVPGPPGDSSLPASKALMMQ